MIDSGTGGLKVYAGDYDFARDGGAVGTIVLRAQESSAGPIPTGAVIVGGYLDVTTAVLSATGTVALTVESAGDMLAAVGAAGLTLGIKSIIPVATGATAVKATANRSPSMAIATAALTAGKFTLVLLYR